MHRDQGPLRPAMGAQTTPGPPPHPHPNPPPPPAPPPPQPPRPSPQKCCPCACLRPSTPGLGCLVTEAEACLFESVRKPVDFGIQVPHRCLKSALRRALREAPPQHCAKHAPSSVNFYINTESKDQDSSRYHTDRRHPPPSPVQPPQLSAGSVSGLPCTHYAARSHSVWGGERAFWGSRLLNFSSR